MIPIQSHPAFHQSDSVMILIHTANNIKFGRDYASALAWILFMIEIVVIGVYTLILQLANKHYD